MNYPSMERLAESQLLVAELAKIKRKVTLGRNQEFENDVEHSFGLSMTCWYLHPFIAPELDLSEVLQFALAHDIVEIHAGDVYLLDKTNFAKKDQREREALTKLRTEWPDFNPIIDYAEQYMNETTEEARFVKAVDKMLPVLMLGLGEGFDVHHKRDGLTLEALRENKNKMHISAHVSPYYEQLFVWLEKTESKRKANL